MTLAAGSRLGPYEIVAPIGAGGMGEVYRARDTRLDREVAVKVLLQHLSSSPETRKRFEREAKTISQLSHPHICALYDVGREGDVDYLVMEYLEGETVAAHLAKGALPLEQTLRFGVEIADALEKAHRQGIVHRDLKPGNVMLTKSGTKLLDFGLAKLQEADPSSPFSPPSALPTHESPLTAEGTILGTLQYMAPEQLEGKVTDGRTDIFAFGALLYEMATGQKAFSGATQASLIGAILHTEPPPVSAIQRASPAALDRVVKTCLAKDPEDRWQSAADAGRQLRWIAEESTSALDAPRHRPVRGARSGWLVAGALTLVSIALAAVILTRRPAAAPALRASILPPPGSEFVSMWIDAGPVEISPDGSRLVFTARKGEGPNLLWVRSLADSSARPLAGTEGAYRPFWSPDGRFIGFFADRALKKIDVNGGPVFKLAEITDARGGTWNREGVILFTPDSRGPMFRVSAEGGKAEPASAYGPNDATHRFPRFLPDGKHFLYVVRHSGAGEKTGREAAAAGPEPEIRVGKLDSKDSRLVKNVASNALYASGYLLYVLEGALVAQAFDLDRLAVEGEPVTLVPDVRMDERFSRGVFSASDNGMLVYQTGKGDTPSVLHWLDRRGTVLSTLGEPAQFVGGPRISPDGTRVAASIVDVRTGVADIWMVDRASGTRSRFTTGRGDKVASTWSPDGSRIPYSILKPDLLGYDIVMKATNGSAVEEKLVTGRSGRVFPCSFSPDARFLVFVAQKEFQSDLWALPLQGDRRAFPVVASPAVEQDAQFSPNGRYLAYVSDESGRMEIYVMAFPGTGARWQVSQNGGIELRWRRDGKELFFFAPDNRLMAAQVETDGESFKVGAIEPLFQARSMGFGYRYDAASDGQSFLMATGLPQELSPITVVTDWTTELVKKK